MSGPLLKPLAWAALLALAGCATPPTPSDTPEKTLQLAAVPDRLPVAAAAAADTPTFGWRDVVRQPRLAQLVELALQGNRDLRVTVLNVQRAQAQLTVAEANRLPTLGVGVSAARAPNSKGEQANNFAAGLQVSSWELDLFGRLANLSESARAQLLASQAGQRAAELTLAATVVQTALVLQADDELLVLARQSLRSREQSLKLAQLRESVGAASLLELQVQEGLAAQARATLAQLTRQQSQDVNTLALLLGQPVPPGLLSTAGSAPLAGPQALLGLNCLLVGQHEDSTALSWLHEPSGERAKQAVAISADADEERAALGEPAERMHSLVARAKLRRGPRPDGLGVRHKRRTFKLRKQRA